MADGIGAAPAANACENFQQSMVSLDKAQKAFDAAKAAYNASPASVGAQGTPGAEKADLAKAMGTAYTDLMQAKQKNDEAFQAMSFDQVRSCGPAPMAPPNQRSGGVQTGGGRNFG